MVKHKTAHKRRPRKKHPVYALLTALVLLAGLWFAPDQLHTFLQQWGIVQAQPAITLGNGLFEVLVVDVGQGDCIVVKSADDAVMLVDAGERSAADKVCDTLRQCGIERIDILVATHPHSDHIGAMASVINAGFSIGKIYMPDVISATATFEGLLDTLQQHKLTVTVPRVGRSFALGSAKVTVVGPVRIDADNLNNSSLLLHIRHGETSILLGADAENAQWNDSIDRYGEKMRADVLKLAHHGSENAISGVLLDTVQPHYAIVSVGEGNDYGHPHAATLAYLRTRNIPLLRTDSQGDILMQSDGEELYFIPAPVLWE